MIHRAVPRGSLVGSTIRKGSLIPVRRLAMPKVEVGKHPQSAVGPMHLQADDQVQSSSGSCIQKLTLARLDHHTVISALHT
jgi:hypothetical protein